MAGFSRRVAGYPRYSVIGDESLGEFHLEIVNSTLDDEAVYECQVAPAGGDSALQGIAHLSVAGKSTCATCESCIALYLSLTAIG